MGRTLILAKDTFIVIYPVRIRREEDASYSVTSNKVIVPDPSLSLNLGAYRFTVSLDEHMYLNDLIGDVPVTLWRRIAQFNELEYLSDSMHYGLCEL